jgi:hypothetical protein
MNTYSETDRIRFLVHRDGAAEARVWMKRTLDTYRTALNTPQHYATTVAYKELFEQSVATFESWLAQA